MNSFGKSQTVKRVEDLRLLTGAGRYVDDIAPKNALHALFFRAPVAHATIDTLDLTAATDAPGVHGVYDAQALIAAGMDIAMSTTVLKNRDGSDAAAPLRPILAMDRVRFVGEAIAMIIADSREAARDAAELIEFAYTDLPVAMDLASGGPEIHPEAPENLAYDWALGDEAAVDAAFAAAHHVTRLRVEDNRIIVNSLEPRGAYAEWDGARLHVCVNGQGVWDLKDDMARVMALPVDAVRITNPDVGGGFGMKGMAYPEYFAIAHAARVLGRPVRWMSDRTEAMLTDNAGRDLVSDAELALDTDGRILAYRVNTLSNLGAYNSEFGQPIQSQLFAKVLTGAYDIPLAFMNTKGIYTNTTQVDAYRGAGRPEAITVLERVMDKAARDLGLSPFEIRRRNFIANDAFPYRTASGELYDVGDFPRVLARAEVEGDVTGFAARRADSAARGRLRGMGLCYYIESILGDPTEGAAVEFNADGTVSLFVGTQSNGQGHETVYAQFLADRTGLPLDAIRIIQGDSDQIARGGGTGGSRSVTVQSTATLAMVDVMVRAFVPFLEAEIGAEGVSFADGTFRTDASNRAFTLAEAADLARVRGRTDLLKHHARAKLQGRSYPNGAHLAEVEIDPETGALTLDRYSVVDDFGNLMHPVLAMGQVHGGIAQGFGQAVTERVAHDAAGQLLTASFMDYAMPRASDLPMIRFASEPTPSTANPLGMKGCGEAGTVGALAALSNAVLDALQPAGVQHVDMPFTPERVWNWLRAAEGARAAAE